MHQAEESATKEDVEEEEEEEAKILEEKAMKMSKERLPLSP